MAFPLQNCELNYTLTEIFSGIIAGYDRIAKLSAVEKQAIPYIIYSIQMIFIAWLDQRDEYKEIAIQNRNMLDWLWRNRSVFSEV